jgi:SAM-dependent methyltransferase
MNERHEQNRRSWNAATRAHNSHKRDQAAFLRGGGSTLFDEERELLGELSGRTLLHLCCNSGQDTLSLARLGARATGVDISDEAVAFASRLSTESGIAAEFERADVLEWLPRAARERRSFDRVYLSYGALNWLSDIRTLFAGVRNVLAPGGRLVVVEFHPLIGVLDDRGERFESPYLAGGAVEPSDEGVYDYVKLWGGQALTPSGWQEGVADFRNSEAAYEFAWSLADIVDAVVATGLRLTTMREWTHANGFRPFETMRPLDGGRWAMPEGRDVPLMLGLVATKD